MSRSQIIRTRIFCSLFAAGIYIGTPAALILSHM